MRYIAKMAGGCLAAALLTLAGCADEEMVLEPAAPRPAHASALTAPLADNSIMLYDQADFQGNTALVPDITEMAPGRLHELGRQADSMSSLRWDLPPGVVVVFYEDAQGRGNQVAVWGTGEIDALSRWDFNNQVSRWAWHYVGEPAGAPALAQAAARSPRPIGAEPTAGVPMGTVALYQDADFQDPQAVLGPIRTVAPSVYQPVGDAQNSMSSLRWNLPTGTVVVLYSNEGGRGQQLVLWGSGQYDSVSRWDFNDEVSRWAWYDVSEPGPF